jgi:hypothetical protein
MNRAPAIRAYTEILNSGGTVSDLTTLNGATCIEAGTSTFTETDAAGGTVCASTRLAANANAASTLVHLLTDEICLT